MSKAELSDLSQAREPSSKRNSEIYRVHGLSAQLVITMGNFGQLGIEMSNLNISRDEMLSKEEIIQYFLGAY